MFAQIIGKFARDGNVTAESLAEMKRLRRYRARGLVVEQATPVSPPLARRSEAASMPNT
jgi:hypothetical protein